MQLDMWDKLVTHAKNQTWSKPALYVVATPIGNLLDLSPRAYYVLQNSDVIAAEDTRTSQLLLNFWGIKTPFMPAHRHNERQAAESIIDKLKQNQMVSLISDAGAPAISDPGSRIVNAVRDAGFKVIAIPGASAVITALMASGATSDENPAFCFAGFIPAKSSARKKWLQQWLGFSGPVVMFETPHRIKDALNDLLTVCSPDRIVTIARELTKKFEEINTSTLEVAINWLQQEDRRRQGEFVIVLHEKSQQADSESGDFTISSNDLMQSLLDVMSVRDAAKAYAKLTKISRDSAYKFALQFKSQHSNS